ncbi:MAG TPA: M20/M25/M40 family metallo-hydrolase [Gemmatimonadaceae bacterium]|nr:M20/M25/M40 family metallo-hydrolase [Gemmatimonadaceae bacterium]
MSALPSLRALWTHPAIVEARHALAARDDAILEMQRAIAEIPAPTGEEARRAAWIAERFCALGLRDVRTDEVGNVIARRAGVGDAGGAAVAVCAHLDTVFPATDAIVVKRDGDRLTGPGVGDNARGLAAMLALAEVLDDSQLTTRFPVEFVATVGEEGAGDLRGAKHYVATHCASTRALIALDGAGDDRVVHRALGSRRFHIALTGPGGHSWNAYGVANPVHALALAAAQLARLVVPSDARTTVSVGRIGGGISVNAIPKDGWLELDARSLAPGALDTIHARVLEIVRAAAEDENRRRTPGTAPLTEDVRIIGDRPGGETPVDHPLVQLAVDATRAIGGEPELAAASTDANVAIALGIPAIAIGAGGVGGGAHTPEEWYDNRDGAAGLARALAIVVGAAGGVAG